MNAMEWLKQHVLGAVIIALLGLAIWMGQTAYVDVRADIAMLRQDVSELQIQVVRIEEHLNPSFAQNE